MNKFSRIFTKHFSAVISLSIVVFIALGCGCKFDAEWQNTLGGKKLTMAKTSNGLSDKVEIWFCPTGEYAKKTQFSGFSGGGGGDLSVAAQDGELGIWKVESGVLYLKSQDGKTSSYDISQGIDSDVISLNNRNYSVTTHNECR